MTRETQTKLLGEFYAEKKNILKLKGEDYANEDVLSNFKTAGANIGISAEQQCLSLIATKVARLGNLLSGKTPNNESVSDSILDLSNYTDLLYCLVNEEEENLITQDDLGKIKSAFNKNKADFLKRKHAKSQPLTIEECFETYRDALIKNPFQDIVVNKINKENPFTQDDVDNFNDSGIKVERNNNGKIEIVEIKKPTDLLRIRNEFNKYRNEFNKNTEPQTKRWENVKPKAIINQIKWTDKCSDTADKIKEEDIFYKGGEPITEPYEPKVGDRFWNKDFEKSLKIIRIAEDLIVMRDYSEVLNFYYLSISDFLNELENDKLKKIN